MPTTINESAATLAALGWSAGETCYWIGYNRVWQIDACRGEHSLVVLAPTYGQERAGAARQAE